MSAGGWFPDPQASVMTAIERARDALGLVAPLTRAQRLDVMALLLALGIPHRPSGASAAAMAPDSDSS